MPLTLAKMAADTASVSFPYSDDTVHITYYPSRITERVLSIANINTDSLQSVTDGFALVNETICTVVKSWDVLEDDNVTMYPLVPDRIAILPIAFRMEVFMAIVRNIRPEVSTPQAN